MRTILFAAFLWAVWGLGSTTDVNSTTDMDGITFTLCEDVRLVPSHQRCEYARKHCSGESDKGSILVTWLQFYYCRVSGKVHAQVFFWVLVVFLCLVLFLMLGDTADKFFGPTLTQISMEVPKMRPRFAGVTLLAFANGAPDLSATVHAIKTCKFDLSLGGLTGAGMFVNCFVAGYIIVVSGGVKCRGATIRDVGAYIITILGLLLSILVGKIGLFIVVLAFVVYIGFVALVFCGDEWHEKGRPDFWSEPIMRVSKRMGLDQDPSVELRPNQGPVWAEFDEDQGGALELSQFNYGTADLDTDLLPASPNVSAVWANYSPSHYRQQAMGHEADDSDGMYNDELEPISEDGAIASEKSYPSRVSLSPSATKGEGMTFFETELPSLAPDQSSIFNRLVVKYPWLAPLWRDMLMEDWGDMGLVARILLMVRFPLVILQRSTIPMTSSEYFNKTWLAISMGFSPLFAMFYFDAFNLIGFLLVPIAGVALAVGVLFFAESESRPPRWSLGTSWPIGAAVVAIYGLVMGVFWIDIVASELVDLLHCIGVVLGIPGAIMGLTVLAWGNSVGDFFTNKSVAKAGKGNMALTACYAGPVFNMLLGLGIGFLVFMIHNHADYASVKSDKQVVLGCLFLLLHGAAVIGIGLWRGMRLPKNFGYFSISLYGLYLAFAIVMEISMGPSTNDYSGQCKM